VSESPGSAPEFDRREAFSRNIGWVTPEEQESFGDRRVAIAGMGGVGGVHLLTLTRLGVGAFTIADYDTFEVANFNRQAGASMSHVGALKVDVMADLARDINPEVRLRKFAEAITEENVAAFLEGADVFLDGIDFFAVEARRTVFRVAGEMGIPALTAAPLGMGCAFLAFLPGRMTFEEYFRMEGKPRTEQLLRFVVGLAPARLHAPCLVVPEAVNLEEQKGPSTPMAADLCAGIAATQVLKLFTGRGTVPAAPRGLHFDAFRNRLRRTWRPGGNRNPVQRLMISLARRAFRR
jgi:molybdopterin/thiamine biosynthesis adenylyltransferase